MAPYDRGVRANTPQKPRFFFSKYWNREIPTRFLSHLSTIGSCFLSGERSRHWLNLLAGETIYFTDHRYIPDLKRNGDHGFIFLPGGCAWALQKHEGCTFCPFQKAVDDYVGNLPMSEKELIAMFEAGFKSLRYASDVINVFTAGSFLNPGEIPVPVQLYITRRIAKDSRARIMRVETRIPYVEKSLVKPIVSILKSYGKTLDLAIGFETKNDWIRNKLMRKGITKRGFENAIEQIHDLKAHASVYLMLKPHLVMGEGYALDQCIESIDYVFGVGADEVLLQALYISPGSPQMVTWKKENDFRPPWLWSIIDTLKATAHLGPVMLGRWDDELPTPIDWPHNCGHCDLKVMEQLAVWRQSLNPKSFNQNHLPTCRCQKEWQREIGNTWDVPKKETG